MKIEGKLYNSDKVHVSSLYLEMQRKGAVMPQNDFMSDFTQRLNIESAKLVKMDMTLNPVNISSKSNSTENAKKNEEST